MTSFSPKLTTLPPVQRQLWNDLTAIPKHFILYGGTAIALQLGHRKSVDFDFFTSRPIDSKHLLSTLTFLKGARVTTSTRDTLNCFTAGDQPVKFSFFSVPQLKRVRPALVAADNRLKVADLLDLAGTKIKVLQDRAEAKDYIDLDAMIRAKAVTLPLAFSAARAIYGSRFSPAGSLLALKSYSEGNLDTLAAAIKKRLSTAADTLDLTKLPSITLRKHSQRPR